MGRDAHDIETYILTRDAKLKFLLEIKRYGIVRKRWKIYYESFFDGEIILEQGFKTKEEAEVFKALKYGQFI
jgi:hypothetical protein